MAIGPVQLIVLGFGKPDFHGEILPNWNDCAPVTRYA
jgi:hypothetical protein